MTGGYEMYWISDEEVDVDFHEEKKTHFIFIQFKLKKSPRTI